MPNRMRKILLLYDSLVAAGGAERLFLEEARYFRARGYDVTTAVFEFSAEAFQHMDRWNPMAKISKGTKPSELL